MAILKEEKNVIHTHGFAEMSATGLYATKAMVLRTKKSFIAVGIAAIMTESKAVGAT